MFSENLNSSDKQKKIDEHYIKPLQVGKNMKIRNISHPANTEALQRVIDWGEQVGRELDKNLNGLMSRSAPAQLETSCWKPNSEMSTHPDNFLLKPPEDLKRQKKKPSSVTSNDSIASSNSFVTIASDILDILEGRSPSAMSNASNNSFITAPEIDPDNLSITTSEKNHDVPAVNITDYDNPTSSENSSYKLEDLLASKSGTDLQNIYGKLYSMIDTYILNKLEHQTNVKPKEVDKDKSTWSKLFSNFTEKIGIANVNVADKETIINRIHLLLICTYHATNFIDEWNGHWESIASGGSDQDQETAESLCNNISDALNTVQETLNLDNTLDSNKILNWLVDNSKLIQVKPDGETSEHESTSNMKD